MALSSFEDSRNGTHRLPVANAVSFLIVGTPRSGTTLVQRLCAELPGVTVPPETHFFSLFVPTLLSRRRMPLAGAELRHALRDYTSLGPVAGLGIDVNTVYDLLHGHAQSLLDIFDAVVRVLGGTATLLGEKTPDHIPWCRVLSRSRPDLRVVAVIRDPRAVVASHLTVPFGASTTQRQASRWAFDARELEHVRNELGTRFLALSYESVVSDPDAARAQLASFLGVPGESRSEGASGRNNGMPLFLPGEPWKDRAEGRVTTERVDAWRETLTPQQIRETSTICATQMRRWGYLPESDPARWKDKWSPILRSGAYAAVLRYRLVRIRYIYPRRGGLQPSGPCSTIDMTALRQLPGQVEGMTMKKAK